MRPPPLPARRRGPSRGQALASLLAVLLVAAALVAHVGLAASGGKTIMLGESLNPDQKKELLDLFNAGPNDKVQTITVQDTKDAMKSVIDRTFDSAYSSTALTCRNLGDGLDVTIKNINLITPSMYAMALVTAGIGDATLIVAAPTDAPAQGLTALTGIFKTWDIAPCDTGSTGKDRQRLALEELALAAQIGTTLSVLGTTDGVQNAADVVLETQKTIVTSKLTASNDIDAALAAQEQAKGIAIPADLRAKVVDLFVRLAKQKIDWSTFAAGWTIKYNDTNTQITMRGEGIAIRHARQTATAQAAANLTATAQAAAKLTATAAANLTATAAANLTATAAAEATNQAIAAMTATAAAQPTITPTPQPTATPSPFAVTGEVTHIGGGQLSVKPKGAPNPVQYLIDADATITRGGKAAKVGDVATGDTVALTVDGGSQHVRALAATAVPVGILDQLAKLWWILPVALIVPALFLVLKKGKRVAEPFVVKRVAAA